MFWNILTFIAVFFLRRGKWRRKPHSLRFRAHRGQLFIISSIFHTFPIACRASNRLASREFFHLVCSNRMLNQVNSLKVRFISIVMVYCAFQLAPSYFTGLLCAKNNSRSSQQHQMRWENLLQKPNIVASCALLRFVALEVKAAVIKRWWNVLTR